jgi:hypothetical protein
MDSPTDGDAIWTPEAMARVQQEFGWGGAALLEKYRLVLDKGGWAEGDLTVVEAFAEWARRNGRAWPASAGERQGDSP